MKRILIVEDEPSIALALGTDLKHEGYDVEIVGDGVAATERAMTGAFDLVLLDVMLPGMDGFDVCRHLRRAGVLAPIILLTARGQESEKVLGFELGADDYVTKPYSARELRARIKAHLRRIEGPGISAEIYRFGDAELDFARCELRRAGRRVDLSALEFKLLSAFVRSGGRMVTRGQLLDAVWGAGTNVTERVVDNQVNNLRKKIEPVPERPRYLIAMRGLGYRFDGEGMTEA